MLDPLAQLKLVTDGERLFLVTDDRRRILDVLERQFVFSIALGPLVRELRGRAARLSLGAHAAHRPPSVTHRGRRRLESGARDEAGAGMSEEQPLRLGGKEPSVVKLTPMLQQYLRVKERYPDAILLYRLGDFYEMFFEDAERASRLLDLTLTSRSKGDDARIPLCGVPHHSVQPYVQKLLEHGHKVAICEQVEDPATAKGIVERKVVRVITPGTVLEEESLDPRAPSYLAAVIARAGRYGLAVVDLSTGELRATESQSLEALEEELGRLRPREVIVAAGLLGAAPLARLPSTLRTSELPAEEFSPDRLSDWLEKRVSTEAVESWRARPLAAAALGALLGYLDRQLVGTDHLRAPEPYEIEEFLVVDDTSRRNLELVETVRGERVGSLLVGVGSNADSDGRSRRSAAGFSTRCSTRPVSASDSTSWKSSSDEPAAPRRPRGVARGARRPRAPGRADRQSHGVAP